jgi:hypothetical protein
LPGYNILGLTEQRKPRPIATRGGFSEPGIRFVAKDRLFSSDPWPYFAIRSSADVTWKN